MMKDCLGFEPLLGQPFAPVAASKVTTILQNNKIRGSHLKTLVHLFVSLDKIGQNNITWWFTITKNQMRACPKIENSTLPVG